MSDRFHAVTATVGTMRIRSVDEIAEGARTRQGVVVVDKSEKIIGYSLTAFAVLCAIAILVSGSLFGFFPLGVLALGSWLAGHRIPLYITLIIAFPLFWCWFTGV